MVSVDYRQLDFFDPSRGFGPPPKPSRSKRTRPRSVVDRPQRATAANDHSALQPLEADSRPWSASKHRLHLEGAANESVDAQVIARRNLERWSTACLADFAQRFRSGDPLTKAEFIELIVADWILDERAREEQAHKARETLDSLLNKSRWQTEY